MCANILFYRLKHTERGRYKDNTRNLWALAAYRRWEILTLRHDAREIASTKEEAMISVEYGFPVHGLKSSINTAAWN